MCDARDFIIDNGILTKYVGSGGEVIIPEGSCAETYAKKNNIPFLVK